jgi:tRNA(His) 5'-end guanylyltransferase
MDNERALEYFKMNMLQATIKMNAMIAENMNREILGQSMAYTDSDFISLIDKHGIHHNAFPFYKG